MKRTIVAVIPAGIALLLTGGQEVDAQAFPDFEAGTHTDLAVGVIQHRDPFPRVLTTRLRLGIGTDLRFLGSIESGVGSPYQCSSTPCSDTEWYGRVAAGAAIGRSLGSPERRGYVYADGGPTLPAGWAVSVGAGADILPIGGGQSFGLEATYRWSFFNDYDSTWHGPGASLVWRF